VTALEALKQPVPERFQPPDLPGLRSDGGRGRWWQVLIAAVGLLVLMPVSLAIAVAIKLTSRGPVLYRGVRIGQGLGIFTIFKFRTLVSDAEQRIGARLLTPGDPLYTPIGRFLKKYKLDEIPQLLNVVAGRMNLVGPRPVRPVFLATAMRDIPHYAARFTVRPGMTGLAQLRGGYFTPPRDKLRYDLLYIRRRNAWLDVKLVLATFVKLLNHWLTLGLLLALIFLSASFVPAVFSQPFQWSVGGFHLSPFEALGLLLAAWMLIRQIPAHRLYLYRTPTNWPMAAFVVFSALAGLVAGDLVPRLQDVAYFTASGFLLFFLIVSGEITEEFATQAIRVVALSAVAVSLLGILQIVVQTHAMASADVVEGGHAVQRIVGTLGNPVVLSTYLVLGMPLVLVELSCAERREERDFWLICATLVIVAVLLTQTRTSLLALWLTGSVFCWRAWRRMFPAFVAGSLALTAVVIFLGGLRLSPAAMSTEFARRVAVTGAAVSTSASPLEMLVGPEPGKGALSVVEVETGDHVRRERNDNMHLTLIRRVGLIGWALMMWVIGAALLAIDRGSRAVRDKRLALVLWAIFSSGLGFLVSMSNFNAFYNSTIQIFFWGLLGIGMAIVTHRNGRRPAFNVIWRFGPGD